MNNYSKTKSKANFVEKLKFKLKFKRNLIKLL